MTLICVPIPVTDPHLAARDAAHAKQQGADLIEFRIDEFFSGDHDTHAAENQARQLAALISQSPLPCIVTCRTAAEGGHYDGPEDARIALFEHLTRANAKGHHPPRYIDVEHASYTRSANLRQKINLALSIQGGVGQPNPDAPTSLILSLHDTRARPADLLRRLADMYATPAASVVKVAYTARSLRDSLELLDLPQHAPKPTIALAMGEFGLLSRVLAPKFRGFLTFAPLRPASATAPGQPTLDDLLAKRHQASTGPAEQGWRAGLRRATFGGVKLGPGRAEQQRRVQTAAVRRTFDGPRTVVVLNPKGGAHKTTATMLLAATFGLQRGGYTLAWDNNETRGTLGWRSAHTDHQHTAVDLLQALPSLGGAATVRVGDLDGYVRTQTDEQFDVLASDESAGSASSMDAASFAALHRVLSRFYRVLVIDTGNNMRASNWQAAIDAADQVVVVSTIREDTAQSAAWALDALRATGNDDAVRRAVTILSAPDRKIDKDLRKRLRSHFGALTRAVVEVPYDPSLVSGGPIAYESLRPATRDAWLRATAIVADGL